MSAVYHALKNRINQIINALYHKQYTNCTVAVRVFDIASKILQKRWNENNFKNICFNVEKMLTNEQKQIVRNYIHRFDDINQCVRFKMIVKATNFFIRFENCTIDQLWLNRFFKRNLKFHFQKQKFLTIDRKNNHDLKNMTEYFNKLKQMMKKKTSSK